MSIQLNYEWNFSTFLKSTGAFDTSKRRRTKIEKQFKVVNLKDPAQIFNLHNVSFLLKILEFMKFVLSTNNYNITAFLTAGLLALQQPLHAEEQ